MKGKTHLLFGVGTGCLLAAVVANDSIVQGLGLIGCTAVGSLFPDIDTPTSTISKKFKITSRIFNKMFGHRTFFHSPLCCAIISLVLYLILKGNDALAWTPLIGAFAFGFMGHLFLDALTKGGIPFLYPFKTKRYHLTNIKTGGRGETFVFIGACAISVVAFIAYIYFANAGGIESAPLLHIVSKIMKT